MEQEPKSGGESCWSATAALFGAKSCLTIVTRAGTGIEISSSGSERVFVFGLGYCSGSEDFLFRPFGPRYYSGFEWA